MIALVWLFVIIVALLLPIWYNTIPMPDMNEVDVVWHQKYIGWKWCDKDKNEHPIGRLTAWKMLLDYPARLVVYTWNTDDDDDEDEDRNTIEL